MLFRVSSSFRNLITLGSGMIRSANCHTESSKVAEKRSIWHSEGKALEEKGRWPSPTYQAVALQALASAALSILVAYVVLCAVISSTLTQQVKQPVPIRHQESGKYIWNVTLRAKFRQRVWRVGSHANLLLLKSQSHTEGME